MILAPADQNRIDSGVGFLPFHLQRSSGLAPKAGYVASGMVAADVVYVKGNLSDVSSYVVDLMDSIALTNDLTDSSVPASGAGFYYLVRPDCAVGSWQTSLGAEPGRDLVLP